MAYNMTNVSSADNVFEMYKAVDAASGYYLGYLLIVAVYMVVLFSLLRNNPPPESFTAAGAVTTVVSLMFLVAGITNIKVVVAVSLIFALSAVSLMKN